MPQVIDFYFDYSSPYGYLASERIEKIAGNYGFEIIWHPILLGAVFKITGQVPLTESPMKGEYSIMDFARSAREQELDYQHPKKFPIASVAASRATLWMRDNEHQSLRQKTPDLIHTIFRAYYTQGKDISDPETLAGLVTNLGISEETLLQEISTPSIKDALRAEVNQAIEAGVFGSPMMIVDGERFWGHDRLEQLERWLESGGW